jgi:hypothetical protein
VSSVLGGACVSCSNHKQASILLLDCFCHQTHHNGRIGGQHLSNKKVQPSDIEKGLICNSKKLAKRKRVTQTHPQYITNELPVFATNHVCFRSCLGKHLLCQATGQRLHLMRHQSLSCFTPSSIQLRHLWRGQENFSKPCWMREAKSWCSGPATSNLATQSGW